METTRGWSKGKKHGGRDAFSRGGHRRKAPVPCVTLSADEIRDPKNYIVTEAGAVPAIILEESGPIPDHVWEKSNAAPKT